MPRLNQREPSAKQAEANRRNAQRSTGPRTPQGKQQVRLNALKHGLDADPFVQGMLALHEDPRAYYRLLGDLLASLRPANPHQRLQVEDMARLRVESSASSALVPPWWSARGGAWSGSATAVCWTSTVRLPTCPRPNCSRRACIAHRIPLPSSRRCSRASTCSSAWPSRGNFASTRSRS